MAFDPAAADHFAPVRDAIRRNSLLFLIQGILMVVAGVLAFVYPLLTSVAVTLFLGWMLLIFGVVHLLTLAFSRVPHFWPQLISAALSLVTGLIIIRNPGVAVTTLSLLLVIFFLVEGITKVILSLTVRPLANWGWVLVSGLIGVALALYLIMNPVLSLFVLGLFIGIQLIVEGAAIALLAWSVRKATAV